uniref:Venom S1 protease 43 n=1 Tax=Oncocephalus sp. TaxID=2944721 RepID=A0AB38ZEX0_9HEMI
MLRAETFWAILAMIGFAHYANCAVLQPIKNDIIIKGNVINRDISGNFTPHTHLKYRFRCDKGKSMYVRCQMNVQFTQDPKGSCAPFQLKVYSGTRLRWQCMTEKFFPFISENDLMDLTIDTGDGIKGGNVSCEVKAVHKVVHSLYKNVASEEVDSSEFGQKNVNGPKKTTCDCGWSNKDPKRILFGKEAGKHEYPWSVSLQMKEGKFHFCGGSIITPYHVITAAHCTLNRAASKIIVVMGTNNRSDNTISSDVKKIYDHNYHRKMFINDISIIEVVDKITFNQFIGPVCLPTRDPGLVRKYVTAMGWGRMHDSEYKTRDVTMMKKTNMRVVDIDSCSLDWVYIWEVDDPKVICTWSNHTDICLGDSGGPVVFYDTEIKRYTLVGLPALSDTCKLVRPAAHTAVHYFHKWILNTIANSIQPEARTAQVCTKID